ncbi:MAG: DUF2116 family Zn-ribbon domain-containing protein [Thermoplasmata archaeon]|nr:DUF2116 family Zn-ribbon domain-containing protein [Thermoplasmata archaeon]RLF27900.1 MAG: DUF2116 family Zn-ribbon domain-containing protein [Thermoplasmata archaeon]
MDETVPQHKHCPVCGKAIPLEEAFCSEECKQKYQQMLKRRRQLLFLMYIMLFIAAILIFVLPKIM